MKPSLGIIMQHPELKRWRVRLCYLDWSNAQHWTDWYTVEGLAEYRLSGMPVRVQGEAANGVVLDAKTAMQALPNLAGISSGRYIPPHRVVAIDWEEVV